MLLGTFKREEIFRQAAMALSYVVVDTPMGPFTVGASESFVHEAFFGKPPTSVSVVSPVKQTVLAVAKEQVEQYFAGKRSSFSLPLAPEGTVFQKKAWAALEKIPYGKVISYSEQAELMGEPGKARAVGMANGRNPVCIILPCHRVIGKNGSLTGYGQGLDKKKSLLDFEATSSVAIV